ncbi:hypothetical protein [Pedobacter frigiditerrae]|uniref:hypothetical protein n=1 Tax=Pedobacter frigiditerrae TaxID=2530452 RepID=UPI00292F0483|nr:hypothetical protein [Pedobacter frigiditerrae]
MKLKKVLLITLLLATSSVAMAQDYKKEIEKEFKEYLNALFSKDFEKSMNYLTPEVFKIIPKAQMIKIMEQTFNEPSIEFELKDAKIIEIQNSEKIENKFYSFLSYSNLMRIKFKSERNETTEEKKMKNNLGKLSFEKTFGVQNVKYDDKTEFFEIYVEKPVYAISDNGKNDWKFIVVEKKQKSFLETLLPKKLIEKVFQSSQYN